MGVVPLLALSLLVAHVLLASSSPLPLLEPGKEPVNFTYSVPLAFRNPYLDTVFRSVNTTLDRHFVFPSPVNVTLFTSFQDFLDKMNDQLHPYAFQFSESHVSEVLGGVFDLARAVLVNPPNASSADEFAHLVLSDPLNRQRLEDCMSRCPNPDVYEPYPNPFINTVANAIRRDKGLLSTFKALKSIPSGEGLKRHDYKRILDTQKARLLEEHDKNFEKKYNSTLEQQLTSEWTALWSAYEHAELVGNETAMELLTKKTANVTSQLSSVRKAGMMWRWVGFLLLYILFLLLPTSCLIFFASRI